MAKSNVAQFATELKLLTDEFLELLTDLPAATPESSVEKARKDKDGSDGDREAA